jgi:hypothetical protein
LSFGIALKAGNLTRLRKAPYNGSVSTRRPYAEIYRLA